MGKLSEIFDESEFSCRCGCGFNIVSPELIAVLERLRNHFNSPVIINSGCRCQEYNRKIGGARESQHVQGTAADIVVMFKTPALVADYLEYQYPDKHGVGRYNRFTHIDVRTIRSRWHK